jgi:hypothetical protein
MCRLLDQCSTSGTDAASQNLGRTPLTQTEGRAGSDFSQPKSPEYLLPESSLQVALDIARTARAGSLTEPERLRHFGALLALCLPGASSQELVFFAWQLVGLETFLRTPEGASGSPPESWNANTVRGLITYVDAASGDPGGGKAASDLVRASIGRSGEEDALAAELYGLAGPLGWEAAQQIGALSVGARALPLLAGQRLHAPESDVLSILEGPWSEDEIMPPRIEALRDAWAVNFLLQDPEVAKLFNRLKKRLEEDARSLRFSADVAESEKTSGLAPWLVQCRRITSSYKK